MTRRRCALIASVGLVFTLLTAAFTYPLWTAPQRLLTDIWDGRLNTWILAWDAHALITDPAQLFNANIFHPHRNALAFSENLLGSAILVAPINWAGAPILAYNLALLASFVLCGITATLWIRELTGSTGAGLVGGVVWTFAPARMDNLAQIQQLTGQWIPLVLLLLTRYVDLGRRRYLMAAAAVLGWQYWTAIQLTLLSLPLVGLYLAGLLTLRHRRPQSPTRLRIAGELMAAGLVVAVLVLPLSTPYLQANAAEQFERSPDDLHRFSARPTSLLAPAAANKAAHLRGLSARYRSLESNMFPGLLATVLVFYGLMGWRQRQPAGRRQRAAEAPATTGGARRHARRAQLAAGLGAVLAVAVLIAGLVATALGAGAESWLVTAVAAADPAVWLTLLGMAALLLWRPDATCSAASRRHVLVLTVAAVGYLLAAGPVFLGWDASLGRGPFALLYDWLLPYRSIRAVGRFAVPMTLFLAAAAGFGMARLQRRFPEPGRARHAILALVVVGLAVEYRVAPLEVYDATIADLGLYTAIAELPGDGAVLHVPLEPNAIESEATEYMLGSTLHWRPIANGYSGFQPSDMSALLALEPLTPTFYRHLRQHYPVDHLVVHRANLDALDPGAYARLQAALNAGDRNIESVIRDNDGLILALRRDTDSGTSFVRRFARNQLRDVTAVRFEARVPEARARIEVVWDRRSAGTFEVDTNWRAIEARRPDPLPALPDGTVTLQWKSVPEAGTPIGSTEIEARAEVLVEAQREFLGLAVDDLWLARERRHGLLAVVLHAGGRRAGAQRLFAPDDAAGLADFVADLAPGSIVACAMSLEPTSASDAIAAALARTLRGLGASLDSARLAGTAVVLGTVGAAPGSAVERAHPSRAFVRVGPPPSTAPRFVVRRIRRVGVGIER